MSQTMEQSRPGISDPGFDEFSYKPVPAIAPVALLLGICSASALLSVMGIAFAIFGAFLGTVGFWKIRSSRGEMGGAKLSVTGAVLSLIFLVSGVSYHSYLYATEVPEGFRRVNFNRDISRKGFAPGANGVPEPNPDVMALNGKEVFLKGYMYPTRQTTGIQSFVLVKDTGECCFGGQPQMTDMIEVDLGQGMAVDHHEQILVAVAGVFRVNPAGGQSDLSPIYRLEASHFHAPARTSY